MRYMNGYDLDSAIRRFEDTPNRLRLAQTVEALVEETGTVSDGWAYWPKPARAADKAMALIESATNRENDRRQREDITDAEVTAAVRPIKSFLTRHREVYSADQVARILKYV